MTVWEKIKETTVTVIDLVKSIINIFNRISKMSPVAYMKSLTDKSDVQSSHRFVNLLWGSGSFVFFWMGYFYKLYKIPAYKLDTIDYTFIATMAGISTYAAIVAKRIDSNNPTPPTPPKPAPDPEEDDEAKAPVPAPKPKPADDDTGTP